MITWDYQDDVHTMFNWDTRIAEEYEPGGVVLIQARPFTAEENATADAMEVQEQEAANKSTIEANLEQDYLNMQAIMAQTNAALRDDPSQEIKQMAQAIRRLTRMALDDYSGTE